ncbi:MAG: hypothetical protein M3P85_06590 [Actinomycetota bacterium]|nr:hypothetical protein [Actinomycetota bacterium]
MAGHPHHSGGSTGTGHPAPTTSPAVRTGPEVGLRRVSWVLIIMDGGVPRCQVEGVGHRLPVRRTVPLATAVALIAAGTPYAVRSPEATGTTTPVAGASAHDAARRGERV